MSRVVYQTQAWRERWLSLKGKPVFIIPVIIYHLTVVLYSDSWLSEMEQLLFHSLWKCKFPLVNGCICCQQTLKRGLEVLWLMMRRHAPRLRNLWLYLNGERVWSPFVKLISPRFTSFGDLGPWMKRWPKAGAWQAKSRHAVELLCGIGNVGGVGPILVSL